MKKLFSMFLIAAVAVVGFSSCSSDDDDNSLAANVAGTYTCSVDVSAIGNEALLPATIKITKVSDAVVDFELEGFKFTENGGVIPINLKNVALTGVKGDVKVKSTQQDVSFEMEGVKIEASAEILGTSFIKSKSNFSFDVKVVSSAGIENGATIKVIPVAK